MPQPSEALLRVAEACEGIVHPKCLCGLPQCGECAKALRNIAPFCEGGEVWLMSRGWDEVKLP